LLNLGQLALRADTVADAGQVLHDGLTVSVRVGDQARIADYLDAVGRLATITGTWQRAARLLGAATALYQALGIQQHVNHRGEHQTAAAAARGRIGDGA